MDDLIKLFKRRTGYDPDLDNPKTYCEKVTWDKINRRDDRKVTYSDKFWSREFIKGKSEALPMPEPDGYPIVVKPNNYSGRVRIANNEKELKQAEKGFSNLPRTYGKEKHEWWYSEIEPKLVYEAYLREFTELKFFCYDGVARYIRYRVGKKSRTFFDIKGNNLHVDEFMYGKNQSPQHEESIPEFVDLQRMKTAAEKLSTGFDQVRVDLLWSDNKIYFTEFTFAHASGMVQWLPKEHDYRLGEYWKL